MSSPGSSGPSDDGDNSPPAKKLYNKSSPRSVASGESKKSTSPLSFDVDVEDAVVDVENSVEQDSDQPGSDETDSDSSDSENSEQHQNGVNDSYDSNCDPLKERRDSKNDFLTGWAGDFPNFSSTHNDLLTDADKDKQPPADLKAIGSTGLSIFPRDQQPSPPLQPTTTSLSANSSPKSLTTTATTTTTTATATSTATTISTTASTSSTITTDPSTTNTTSTTINSTNSSMSSPSSAAASTSSEQPQSPSPQPVLTNQEAPLQATAATPEQPESNTGNEPPIEDAQTAGKSADKSCVEPDNESANEDGQQLASLPQTPKNPINLPSSPNVIRARSKSFVVQYTELVRRTNRTRSMCHSAPQTSPQAKRNEGADATPSSSSNSMKIKPLNHGTLPKLPATDPFYRKPFEYGWKRELVLRSGQTGARGDVLFITPGGKKLRARDDIKPLLKGDLTIQHFCFQRVPQEAGPEFEIVRQAVPLHMRRKSRPVVHPSALPLPSKRVPKPKGPKGASPPPEGWTPTMAVKGNARVLAASNLNNNGFGAGFSGSRKRSSLSRRNTAAKRQASGGGGTTGGGSTTSSPGNYSDKEMQCIRCHASISNNREAFMYSSQGTENHCHICMNCLKKSEADNMPANNIDAPEVKAVEVVVPPSPPDESQNEPTEEFMQHASEAGSLEIAEEIELPGQEPPEQLLSDECLIRKRTPKLQEIIVINGRKYISVAGEFVQPISQVIMREPKPDNMDRYYYRRLWPKEVRLSFIESMGDANFGCQVLTSVMKSLTMAERCKMAMVCKTWHMISRDRSVWRTVSLRGSVVINWTTCMRELSRQQTRHLDMAGVRIVPTTARQHCDVRGLRGLLTLRTDPCEAEFIHSIFKHLLLLRELRLTCVSRQLDLQYVTKMKQLQLLHIKMQHESAALTVLRPLVQLTALTNLSLRGISNMNDIDLANVMHLKRLQSLELGSCLGIDTDEFGNLVLPALKRLQHLRLENRHSCAADFPIYQIMKGLAVNNTVERLELVNVDIDCDFSQQLSGCTSVRKLLLMPKYINNAAKTTNAIMRAISDNGGHLITFKLGLTVELLRMTRALCPTDQSNDCIPVVRPVPGVNDADVTDCPNNAQREWAFLPVEHLQSILHQMIPHTKLTVAKISHIDTIKLRF